MRGIVPTAAVLLALMLHACAPMPARSDEPAPDPTGWRFGTAEHVALWIHSLAITGARLGDAAGPAHSPAYAYHATDDRLGRGVTTTPLTTAAGDFRRWFEAEPAFLALDALPLHFRDLRALSTGLRYWVDVDGDSRRAGDREAREMVDLLSSWFPRAAQRRVLAQWLDAVEQEHRLYFEEHWRSEQRRQESLAADVRRTWRALEPAIEPFLRYVRASRGELIVVPAPASRSSMMVGERGSVRVAVGMPEYADPSTAVWLLLRELIEPVADEAMRDHLAPARIRELGRHALLDRAAVRAGALLMDRAAPALAGEYRSFFLMAAGSTAASGADAVERFALAFPLPVDLEAGLEQHVAATMAGI